jgi:hypothetical protein
MAKSLRSKSKRKFRALKREGKDDRHKGEYYKKAEDRLERVNKRLMESLEKQTSDVKSEKETMEVETGEIRGLSESEESWHSFVTLDVD